MLHCNVVKLNTLTQENINTIIGYQNLLLLQEQASHTHTGTLTTASSHTQRLHYLEGLHPCSYIKLSVKLLPD